MDSNQLVEDAVRTVQSVPTIERRNERTASSFYWTLAFFLVLLTTQVFAQDSMIVSNFAGLAQEAFDGDHCLYLPGFPLYCQYFGVSLDGGLAWWVDCTQAPCTNLPPASTDAGANVLLSGVTLLPVQLTWNILTGETTLQPYGSTDVVAVIAAPDGYQPGAYSYDAGVWLAYVQMTNCPDCYGIEAPVPPPTILLAVYLADISQYSIYESNCEAQAYAAATTTSDASMMSGRFMAMDDDEDGGGGDPCTLTNLLQAFYVTNIVHNASGSTTITWESCQFFRYLVFTASSLSTNTQWLPQAYVWGQTNASWTTWTDTATTNDDGSTITQRFYRVQRLLASPIAAGVEHSFAVLTNGTLWAWGWDYYNQLGDSETQDQAAPEPISDPLCGPASLTNAVALAGGYVYSVAVDASGMVWTWGYGMDGEMGNGASTNVLTPSPISGISSIVSVSAASYRTQALRADGTIRAWGIDTFSPDGAGYGALGAGYDVPGGVTNSPIQSMVPTGTIIVAIADGGAFGLALDTTGLVWGWGDNEAGQIGTNVPIGVIDGGEAQGTNTPVLVAGISNVIAIAAGEAHSIALTSDKRVWTWGDNALGELGRSDTNGGYDPLPAPVPGLSNMVAIAGGSYFSLAVSSNGQVFAWGDNSQGQLGTNTIAVPSTNSPMLVAGISNAVWVTAHPDGMHSLAVTVNQGTNQYYAWGYNNNGQVGNGNGDDQYSPALLHFCNACASCVQLGTGGVFTAQCTGTLTLYFNDELGTFGNNTGSYAVAFQPVGGALTNVTVMATNGEGVVVGIVTNGGKYAFSATGYCGWDPDPIYPTVDANGDDHNGNPVSCSYSGSAFTCANTQCFSLVGRIQ